jgi:hypothetical protein
LLEAAYFPAFSFLSASNYITFSDADMIHVYLLQKVKQQEANVCSGRDAFAKCFDIYLLLCLNT